HEPGSTLSCGMNLQVWESLSSSHKAAVQAACSAQNNVMFAEFTAKNGDALETLINEHNVQYRQVNDSIMQRIGEASASVMSEIGASDDITAKIWKNFREFRRKVLRYTAVSETAYANARNLPFEY
ncbi:MAG: ABC transporter substrate-binding protein, partial [Rhodospirillales bacterium]|nr:ABC transporter substrate-binding protein [Rhodospirillales bacterium]